MYLQRERLKDLWEIIADALGSYRIKRFHHVWYIVLAIPLALLVIFMLKHQESSLWMYLLAVVALAMVAAYVMQATKKRLSPKKIRYSRIFGTIRPSLDNNDIIPIR